MCEAHLHKPAPMAGQNPGGQLSRPSAPGTAPSSPQGWVHGVSRKLASWVLTGLRSVGLSGKLHTPPGTPLYALLILASPAQAGDWFAQGVAWDDGRVTVAGESDRLQRHELSLGYRWLADDPHDTGTALRYAHQPLRIRAGNPAHNGYLHQLDARQRLARGPLAAEMSLGVHGTSNMFKHGDFHRDALVATGVLWGYLGSGRGEVGLAGDYLFGQFRVYPRWRASFLAAGGELRLDLPVAIAWGPASRAWRLAVARHGDKWATLDSERQGRDKLYLNEWRAGGHYRIDSGWGNLSLELGAGLGFDTRIRYRDDMAGRITVRPGDRLFGSLTVRW